MKRKLLTVPCGSGKESVPKFIAIDAHQCTYFNHHIENHIVYLFSNNKVFLQLSRLNNRKENHNIVCCLLYYYLLLSTV